jgi:hypothetical protein
MLDKAQTASEIAEAAAVAEALEEAKESASVAEVWPRVIDLAYPFDFGKLQVSQLTFRRGRLSDIKGMKLSDAVPTDNLILIASRMCCQPTALLEKLDVDDAGEVMAIALDFYKQCLTAGSKR